jgi:membrane-associated phospholipid phosphatase
MTRTRRKLAAITIAIAAASATSGARAQDPPPRDATPGTPPSPPSPQVRSTTSATPPSTTDVTPATDPTRQSTLVPQVAEPPLPGRIRFDADPIADGGVIAVSLAFAGLLDLIISTGELTPQKIPATFQASQLLGIDRGAISQTVDPNAGTYSTVGVGAAIGFAVLDPILSGFREHDAQSAIVDGVMYAESLSVTYAMTNLAKVATRRPRPLAYIDAAAHAGDPNYSNTSTDSELSFFSGHAAITAAVGATATYLAFARSPNSARPWITLLVATGLCTFVSIERVRAGAHFPTDVIAGAIAGAGVGTVVPHLHRNDDIKQRPVWIGFAPAERGAVGGTMNVGALF